MPSTVRVALLSAFLIGTAFCSFSEACIDQNPLIPVSVHVIRTAPTAGTVTAYGYKTFGATPGQFCACAFAPADSACIRSINSATIMDAVTHLPIGGFSFSANNTTSSSFNSAFANPLWRGFWSGVSTTIPAGTEIDLMFDMTFRASCTTEQIRTNLLGGGARFGNDEATAGGALTGNHQQIRSFSIVFLPFLGLAGVLAAAAGFAGLGLQGIRRRRTTQPLV